MRHVRTFLGSNPGGTLTSCAKLLIINPAPTSKTKLRATSETTSESRHKRNERPTVAALVAAFKISLTSGRDALRVGTRLNSRPSQYRNHKGKDEDARIDVELHRVWAIDLLRNT